MKTITITRAEYDRMREELAEMDSRHGMELAKMEAGYQERIKVLEDKIRAIERSDDR